MVKISIVTPCFNAEASIQETIDSVLQQTAIASQRVELEYIICDGKSTDRTVEIINNIDSASITLISEPDRGMYDALAKGLKLVSGDIVAYINAGDYYHKCAFDIVTDIFERDRVHWLTGHPILYNEMSYAFPSLLPYKYRQRFFECGMYLGKPLPSVQQESTFWSAKLNSSINFETLSRFELAGDFYLWQHFARQQELKIVDAYIGGFKFHSGQLSENIDAYLAEASPLLTKPNFLDLLTLTFDRAMFYLAPNKIKKIVNPHGMYRYNHKIGDWY